MTEEHHDPQNTNSDGVLDEETARLLRRQLIQQQAILAEQELASTDNPRPTRQPRQRKKSPYKNGMLLLTGLICFGLLLAGLSVLWGSYIFLRQLDVDTAIWVPLLIFFGSLGLATALVTALSKGGTVYPVLTLWLLSCLINFMLVGTKDIQLMGVLTKLVVAFLVSTSTFTLVKLHYVKRYRRERRAADEVA